MSRRESWAEEKWGIPLHSREDCAAKGGGRLEQRVYWFQCWSLSPDQRCQDWFLVRTPCCALTGLASERALGSLPIRMRILLDQGHGVTSLGGWGGFWKLVSQRQGLPHRDLRRAQRSPQQKVTWKDGERGEGEAAGVQRGAVTREQGP